MSKVPSLDSLNEPYPGFARDRTTLKAWLNDADGVWRKAFVLIRKTDVFYQRKEADVVRETMRVLLSTMPARKGDLPSRSKPKK